MASGLTAWLFLLSMKGCFANTISFNGTSSSPSLTTIVRPSSLAVPNLANTSTALPTATILLSTFHPKLNMNFSSSILQSQPSGTIFSKNNRIIESKLTTIHHTRTKTSLTTRTLLPTPLSGSISIPSTLPKANKTKSFNSSSLTTPLSGNMSAPSTLPEANKTKSFKGSLWTVNSSLPSNISTRTVSTQQNLATHQESSSVQFLSSTVVPTVGSNTPEDASTRESLLSGQLAGVALILFILVVLLLIICLGNFADEPVVNERELFTEEVSMENLGRDKDNQGQQEDEEWKFDPLFAWSPRKSFDSKL